jgi:hypothetical protein
MTPTLKKKLLARINAGMDGDSACADLGIPVIELTNASKRFAAQIDEATRAGSARLRGRLFKNALAGDDTKYLQDLLDKRANASADQTVTKIQRIIIGPEKDGEYARCHHCGKAPFSKLRKPTNGQAAT